MTVSLSDIDSTISVWRRRHVFAYQVWGLMSDERYPGGGWERVRALMIEHERGYIEQQFKLAA